MRSSKAMLLLIHGWTIFAHPLLLAQLEIIVQQVDVLKEKGTVGYVKKNANCAGDTPIAVVERMQRHEPQMRETRLDECRLAGLFVGPCEAAKLLHAAPHYVYQLVRVARAGLFQAGRGKFQAIHRIARRTSWS